LDLDNIERPNTRWVFVKFANITVKAVRDNQPMLGTGRLPEWLRNLARARAGPIVALDTFADNLCLERCIAVHQGARPDRSTRVARELAQSYFQIKTAPTNVPKTLLDELDKMEKQLNQGKPLSGWLCIRVYEPEQTENGEILWHLRKSPSDKIKNTMTIGEAKVLCSRGITKLA